MVDKDKDIPENLEEIIDDSIVEYAVERELIELNEDHLIDLSAQQTVFALEYIKNGYKLAPAVRAAVGKEKAESWKNKRTATQIGHNWLKKEKVFKFIHDQLNARCKRLELSVDVIARQYYIWSQIDVTEFVELRRNETGKPIICLKCELEALPRSVRTSVRSLTTTAAGDVKIEFIDQKGALDSLTKLLGFNNEKLQIGTADNSTLKLIFDMQDKDA
jgi:superfamily II helicase